MPLGVAAIRPPRQGTLAITGRVRRSSAGARVNGSCTKLPIGAALRRRPNLSKKQGIGGSQIVGNNAAGSPECLFGGCLTRQHCLSESDLQANLQTGLVWRWRAFRPAPRPWPGRLGHDHGRPCDVCVGHHHGERHAWALLNRPERLIPNGGFIRSHEAGKAGGNTCPSCSLSLQRRQFS